METKELKHELQVRWEELKKQNQHLRIRNAAAQLQTTEVQLLSTISDGSVVRLQPQFHQILKEVERLGKVMALTRNDDVVHERKGVYLNPELENPHVGLFVGEDIDLRIFFSCWKYAFSVTEGIGEKERKSLQFFANDGEAIHKIYLTSQSNVGAFDELVAKYSTLENEFITDVSQQVESNELVNDDQIDLESFHQAWLNMQDTHEFFGILKKHKLSRTQALRLAPAGNYAVKVNNTAMRIILNKASETQTPIMVFVGNKGMLQIHTGTVKKVIEMNGWYNVLDPDFNLHVQEKNIAESWIVRKPCAEGIVTALECFDAEGKQIIQFFGKRKPGIPELEGWKKITSETENETGI